MRLAVIPGKAQLPPRGGVREHMIQLYKQLDRRMDIEMVGYAAAGIADVLHVESSYKSPVGRAPDVYVCHGGFVPRTIPEVIDNLNTAKIIVSVARWMVDEFFPEYADRTVVIPNGVDLTEWENPAPYQMKDYILYAKGYEWYMDDFIWLTKEFPTTRFVTTNWPAKRDMPINVKLVGWQTKQSIASLIANAACVMLPGPEVCPTMLLESWACGTPVLAKDCGGSAELMRYNSPPDKDGKPLVHGGILYKDRSDLAHCASLVYAWRPKLVEQAKWKVRQMFQWSEIIEKYIALYDAVCTNQVEQYLATHSLASQRPKAGVH